VVVKLKNTKFNKRIKGYRTYLLLFQLLSFLIFAGISAIFPTNQLNNQTKNSNGIQLETSAYSYISMGVAWTYQNPSAFVSYDVTSVTASTVMADEYENGIFQQNLDIAGSFVADDAFLATAISIWGTYTANYGGVDLIVTSGGVGTPVIDISTGIVCELSSVILVAWYHLQQLSKPILQNITPNPSNSGSIFLEWNYDAHVGINYIYRSNTTITSVVGMTPIGTSTTNSYTDTVTVSDEYSYVVVAGNILYNSTLSNCESVVVNVPIPVFEPLFILIGLTVITTVFLFNERFKKQRIYFS